MDFCICAMPGKQFKFALCYQCNMNSQFVGQVCGVIDIKQTQKISHRTIVTRMPASVLVILSTVLLSSVSQPSASIITIKPPCPFAHFQTESKSCVECPLWCPTCSSMDSTCKQCSAAFRLVNSTDQPHCVPCAPGLLLCEPDKILCQRYYRLDKAACLPLCAVDGCDKCDSIFSSFCLQCKDGYKLNDNKTLCTKFPVNVSISNFRTLQQQENQNPLVKVSQSASTPALNLTNCLIDQYLDQNSQCQKCGPKCSTCINSGNQCLSCSSGYMFRGWKCIANEHVEYNMTFGVPTGQGGFALGDGISLIKNKLLADTLPTQYAALGAAGLGTISIVKAAIDNTTYRMSLTGIIDRIGTIGVNQLRNQIGDKLKALNFVGPLALLSSSVGIPQPLANNSAPANSAIPDNSNNSMNEGQWNGAKLAKILIPSIALGLSLLTGLLCCVCALCQCCCYKQKGSVKFSAMQPYQSQRRLMTPSVSGSRKEIIASITPIKTQRQLKPLRLQTQEAQAAPQPVPPAPKAAVAKKMPTITSTSSIHVGSPKRQSMPADRKEQRMGSLESLQEMPLESASRQSKIKIGRPLTLEGSVLADKPIRASPSNSGSAIRVSEQIANNKVTSPSQVVSYEPGDIIRQYARDGQLIVEKVQQDTGMQLMTNSNKYRYLYINSKGEQVPIKNLPQYMANQDNLRDLNIKNSVNRP